MILTEVPEELTGRGIAPREEARGFTISLDRAEPWGGGGIEGRVEARPGHHEPHPVTVAVRCLAAWLDLPSRVPTWLEEEVWLERWELGDLVEANWLRFAIELPEALPRAFEGTYVAFRWRVEASRPRRLGHDTASLPLLLVEPRTEPTVRVETSPAGTWRLAERRSEGERDAAAGPCSVVYEELSPSGPEP